ncbi:MAG: hypothetical protein KGJ02_00880 [Verrucomicrobiota bacterium]|nr:hypothetical protein [Verrucomicrobiota bacterium]
MTSPIGPEEPLSPPFSPPLAALTPRLAPIPENDEPVNLVPQLNSFLEKGGLDIIYSFLEQSIPNEQSFLAALCRKDLKFTEQTALIQELAKKAQPSHDILNWAKRNKPKLAAILARAWPIHQRQKSY